MMHGQKNIKKKIQFHRMLILL